MKKTIIILMLALTLVGCKSKFELSLAANERYAAKWSKEGKVARYIGYSSSEQAHYVVFAKADIEGTCVFEGTSNGNTVYSYNKHVSDTIYKKYKKGDLK